MSEMKEMLTTLHVMAMKGEISTLKGTFRSPFDGSIQRTMSEYDKAVKFVKERIVPSWLINKIRYFKRRYC